MAHRGDRSTGSSSPEMYMLHKSFLEVECSPTIEPADSKTESSQAEQLTRKEQSPTHQQTIGLKIY